MKLIGHINLAPNLTIREKALIEVRNEPMIKDLSKQDVEKAVIKAIGYILSIKGLNDISKVTLDFTIEFVSKTLKETFTTYRLSEIQQACEMWAIGELFSDKDLNQLSAENIFKAIHRFNERVKKEANSKQKIHEESLEKVIIDADREKKIQEYEQQILKDYEYFKENFELDYLPLGVKASYYRYLDKKKIFELSLETKQEIYGYAKRNLEVVNTSIDLRFYNATERVENKNKKEAQIVEESEGIALDYLFEELYKNNIDLKTLINA